jgi:hypothetical protein
VAITCTLLIIFPCEQVTSAADIAKAERLIFPGVGAFEQAMGVLAEKNYIQPLKDYILVSLSRPGNTASLHMHSLLHVLERGLGFPALTDPIVKCVARRAGWQAVPGHLPGLAAAV